MHVMKSIQLLKGYLMAAMPSEHLQESIDSAKTDANRVAVSLDKLIIQEADIPHDLRLLLINLLSTVRKQNLTIELMAMDLDHLTALHNIVMEHLRTPV